MDIDLASGWSQVLRSPNSRTIPNQIASWTFPDLPGAAVGRERGTKSMRPSPPGQDMKRRVVVTGLGTVNPVGIGVEESWKALCAGKSGVRSITKFDCSGMRTKVGGEVHDFNAMDFIPQKLARRTDRSQHFALAAAHMAVDDAKLRIVAGKAERFGVSIGSAYGGIESTTSAERQFMNGGREDLSPFIAAMVLACMASGQVAIRFGARGPMCSPAGACAAGTHAIGDAYKLIQHGEADVMIAGGTEAALVPILYQCFGTMGATTARSDDPCQASRPFEADRDGFVPSEGAAILLLEEMKSALRRGARIYGEIAGCAATADAYHVTSPAPGGEGAARCMRLALKDAGLMPQQIDHINAHGTSTKLNDSTETEAIKAVFGESAQRIPVTANKSMLGHTMGASGAIQALFSILTINTGIIPPTINFKTPDPECNLDYVPNVAREARVKTVLSNSFGFGGVNGVLVLREFSL